MSRREGHRALIMAGGTGGHVIPALSLARGLVAEGVEVAWLGSPRGIENRLVPEAGIPLHRIAVSGLRGNGLTGWLLAPFNLVRAVWQAGRVIRDVDPQLVVGLGGFASGPGGLAAWLVRRPLVIHEQNAVAGLTNRVLSRLARRVYAAFPQAFPGRAEVIGNPVRDEIARLGEAPRRAGEMAGRRLRLLVVGGSLGAQALNARLPEALARLPEAHRPEVWHQAGRDKEAATRHAYDGQGVVAEVTAFIDDMAGAWAQADLAICRAGALTVAELAAAGVPSILVPFPYAVDDHQYDNAAYLTDGQAAWRVRESEFNASWLAERLGAVTRGQLLSMARNARGLARTDAAEQVAEACMEVTA